MFVQYPEQFNLLVKNLIRIPTLDSQWAIITWWRQNRWLETGFMFDYEATCICVQLFIVHIWYLGFPAVVYFKYRVTVLIIDSPAIRVKTPVFQSISKLPLDSFITKLYLGLFTRKILKNFCLQQTVPVEFFSCLHETFR